MTGYSTAREFLEAENRDLRARLAEVEAERDALGEELAQTDRREQQQQARTEAAEARLADVEALAFEINDVDHSGTRVERIRAIVRREGNRPAEAECHCGWTADPECHCGWTADPDCPRHSGEGDRPTEPHEFVPDGRNPADWQQCDHPYCGEDRDHPIHSGEADR